jgi:hypothetical protein
MFSIFKGPIDKFAYIFPNPNIDLH